ncbi:MAG: outer spore coat protein CotE [Bacillota bacterium]|jgi:spore coat protein E
MSNNLRIAGSLREIVTRAVCAKGQKRFRQVHNVVTSQPLEGVLGYRVAGHKYTATPKAHSVEIKGQYDLHIWYAYADGNQTAVERKTVTYTEYLPVVDLEGERLGVDEVVSATMIRDPEVVSVRSRRGAVQVEVEMEYYAEIVGETKLWVRVYEPPYADEKKKDLLELDEAGEYYDEDDFDGYEDDEFEDEDFADFEDEEIEP